MVQIKMDPSDFEDFESYLESFSEIPTSDQDAKSIPIPKIMEDYDALMNSNRTGSMYDDDHLLSGHDDGGDVTYVISGRGRGGKNTYYRPGGPISGKVIHDNDEEVRQELRKVAGLGYSNELIVADIKRKQAQILGEESPMPSGVSTPKSNASSRSNSRIGISLLELLGGKNTSETKNRIDNSLKEFPELKPTSESPTRIGNSSLDISELKISSDSSSPKPFVTTEKDSTYSDRYQDCRSTTPSSSSNTTNESYNTDSLNKNHSDSNSPISYILEKEENNTNHALKGAVPKKPLPLSMMLKQNRRNREAGNANNNLETDTGAKQTTAIASAVEVPNRRKLPALLDVSENKRNLPMKNVENSESTTSRIENRSEELPWRRRGENMSPPRFVWGPPKNTTKTVNIRSIKDFPLLK